MGARGGETSFKQRKLLIWTSTDARSKVTRYNCYVSHAHFLFQLVSIFFLNASLILYDKLITLEIGLIFRREICQLNRLSSVQMEKNVTCNGLYCLRVLKLYYYNSVKYIYSTQ